MIQTRKGLKVQGEDYLVPEMAEHRSVFLSICLRLLYQDYLCLLLCQYCYAYHYYYAYYCYSYAYYYVNIIMLIIIIMAIDIMPTNNDNNEIK